MPAVVDGGALSDSMVQRLSEALIQSVSTIAGAGDAEVAAAVDSALARMRDAAGLAALSLHRGRVWSADDAGGSTDGTDAVVLGDGSGHLRLSPAGRAALLGPWLLPVAGAAITALARCGATDLRVGLNAALRVTRWVGGLPGVLPELAESPIGRALDQCLPQTVAHLCTRAMSDPPVAFGSVDGRVVEVTATPPVARNGDWTLRLRERPLLEITQDRLARRDRLLHSLFDLSPVGVLLVDGDTGRIDEANAAFLNLCGRTHEQVIGQDFRGLLPEPQLPHLKDVIATLQRVGHFGPLESAFQRVDGRLVPVVTRGLMVQGGAGRNLVWIMVEDVSEARAHLAEIQQAHDAAVRARAQLDVAVQALPHGFIVCDADDRIVMVNEQMQTAFPDLAADLQPGQPCALALQRALDLGMIPAAVGQERAFLRQMTAARRKGVFTGLVRLADGRRLRMVEQMTPQGGRVGLVIDVTAEHQIAERLGHVIEGSQVGTWECDLRSGANLVNDRWASMLGRSLREVEPVTIDGWLALMHSEDRKVALAKLDDIRSRRTDHFEGIFRVRHTAGHWVWVQSRGRVSACAYDGTPLSMSGVHVDVSALKQAEERLARIIAGAKVGTWQYDVRLRQNKINERWAEILGYRLSELVPMDTQMWEALIHPEDLQAITLKQQQNFAVGEWAFEYELRLLHKQGHWVWVLSRGVVTQWDDHGQPQTMSGVHLDISTRKQLEMDLRAERDFLSQMMDTSISGIMAVDDQGRIVFCNREVQSILEVPISALVGAVFDPALLGVTDLQGTPVSLKELPCQRAMALGQTLRDLRLRVVVPGGRVKVVSINAAPMQRIGATAQAVCTVTDITPAAEAEDLLRAAMARAETANRAKSEFLANMSHELRTPLNGVLGMTGLLAEGGVTPEQADMLQTIQDSGVLLLSILNDILDLAKIESGKLQLEHLPFDMAVLTNRIAAMHAHAAKSKSVALTVNITAAAQGPWVGDPQRVLQVLNNLVGNAVKFTEAGSVAFQVDVDPAGLVITVRDTGIGMTKDQAALVFDEFTQGDGTITRRFGGTGLGLPIARRLVVLMGGQIELCSHIELGTTVTVHLPLARAPAPIPAILPPVPGHSRSEREACVGLRALVAEDNATNRMILRAMLDRLGVSAVFVHDGDEAVAAWKEQAFDLIFLDISMPRKDGVTALEELRAKAGSAGLPPTIAVTANAMTHHVEDYLRAGFSAVAAKPLQLDDLAAAIARVSKMAAP